jgi:DNA-binding CsgD family transcriptional regulator
MRSSSSVVSIGSLGPKATGYRSIWRRVMALTVGLSAGRRHPRLPLGCRQWDAVVVDAVRARLRGQVAEAIAGISSLTQLGDALSHGLGTAVPHDGWALARFDPVSGVRTLSDGRHGLRSATQARLAINEIVDRDAIRFTNLVRQGVPAGVLGGGAASDKRSARLHELFRPEGFGSELRVCLRHRGAVWGGLILLRRDDVAAFSDQDAALIAYASAPALNNLRPRPSRPPRPLGPPPAPGVVILDETNTVQATSRQAKTWFADLGIDAGQTPRVVYELGLAARRRAEGGTAGAPVIARVQTASGRWLALQAGQLDDQHVAVTLYPPTARELLPAFAAWNSYTPRECQVVASLLDGLASKQIAHRLDLSIHTVDYYLTSIFRKTDVTGREDLVAEYLY